VTCLLLRITAGGDEEGSGARGTSRKNPRRQKEERAKERQYAAHGEADETERQQKQPDDGVEHECQQGHRPAHHQKNQPDEKGTHDY